MRDIEPSEVERLGLIMRDMLERGALKYVPSLSGGSLVMDIFAGPAVALAEDDASLLAELSLK